VSKTSRRIGAASMIWAAGILLSRFIGIFREAVIGRVLGSGADADVYFAAFTLPDFLGYLLASGALSLVFIPIFTGYLTRGDEEGGWRIFSTLFNVLLLLMVTACAILWLATPVLAPILVAPGFDAAQTAELVRVIRIMLPAQIFHVLGGLLGAVLMARDQHVWPAMAPLLYSLGIVGCGIALGGTLGPAGFAWGVLLGSVAGPFGLNLIGALRSGMRWRPVLDLGHPDLKRYFLLSLPIMLGFSVIVVDDWVLKAVGSTLGEGVVAKVSYAKTLMKVPMGVFGLATGAATFPTITRLVAEGKKGEAYETLIRACRAMLVLAFAAQVGFTVAGPQVAEVIWGTTRFTTADLEMIGGFTGLFCLGLWAWAAQTVVSRGFYAMQNTWAPTLLGTGVMVAAYPMYVALGGMMGGRGLVIASSITISTYVALLSLWLRRKMAPPASAGIWDLLVRMGIAVGIGIAAGEGVEAMLAVSAAGMPALISGAIAGGSGVVVALVAGWVLRVREVTEVVGLVVGKVRRKLGR